MNAVQWCGVPSRLHGRHLPAAVRQKVMLPLQSRQRLMELRIPLRWSEMAALFGTEPEETELVARGGVDE